MCLEQSALAHFIRFCRHCKQAQGHKPHKLKHGVGPGLRQCALPLLNTDCFKQCWGSTWGAKARNESHDEWNPSEGRLRMMVMMMMMMMMMMIWMLMGMIRFLEGHVMALDDVEHDPQNDDDENSANSRTGGRCPIPLGPATRARNAKAVARAFLVRLSN